MSSTSETSSQKEPANEYENLKNQPDNKTKQKNRETDEGDLKECLNYTHASYMPTDTTILRELWRRERNKESAKKSRIRKLKQTMLLERQVRANNMEIDILNRAIIHYDEVMEAILIFVRTIILRFTRCREIEGQEVEYEEEIPNERWMSELDRMMLCLEYLCRLRTGDGYYQGVLARLYYSRRSGLDKLIDELIENLRELKYDIRKDKE